MAKIRILGNRNKFSWNCLVIDKIDNKKVIKNYEGFLWSNCKGDKYPFIQFTGSVIDKDSIKQVSLTPTDYVLQTKNCVSVRNNIKYEIKNCINFGC